MMLNAMRHALPDAMQNAMRDAMRNAMQRRGEERRGLRGEGGHLYLDTKLSHAREEQATT